MKISIPNVIDATFMLGHNSASGQICVRASDYKRYVGKNVSVTFEDGNRLEGIITGVTDTGATTGVAKLTVNSIVKVAMGLAHKGSSTMYNTGISTDDAGECYKGVMFGTPDETTGEYEKTSIDYFLKKLINNASEQSRTLWGKRIEYQSTGAGSGKLVTKVNWTGDKIETLFFNLLGTTFDIVIEINGNTITVRNIDKNAINKTFSTKDIHSQSKGFDLMASCAQVIVESPDVNSHLESSVTLSSSKRFYGMPANLDDTFGTNSYTGTVAEGYFDAEKNVFKYKTPTAAGNFEINFDKRYRYSTMLRGEAYTRYNWRLPAVIIDDELGRAGEDNSSYLNVTFDRTSEMADIAEYYADVISDIEWQGSLSIRADKRVRVGDVVRLPTGERIVIMTINYDLSNPLKIITYGNIEGNAYEAIKQRVQLSEYIHKEKEVVNERAKVPPLPKGVFVEARPRSAINPFANQNYFARLTSMGLVTPRKPLAQIVHVGGTKKGSTHDRIKAHREKAKERIAKQSALNDVNEIMGD